MEAVCTHMLQLYQRPAKFLPRRVLSARSVCSIAKKHNESCTRSRPIGPLEDTEQASSDRNVAAGDAAKPQDCEAARLRELI